jgi:hypothetical protein
MFRVTVNAALTIVADIIAPERMRTWGRSIHGVVSIEKIKKNYPRWLLIAWGGVTSGTKLAGFDFGLVIRILLLLTVSWVVDKQINGLLTVQATPRPWSGRVQSCSF